MATLLLTWNPDRWHWANLAAQVRTLESGEILDDRWSTGVRTNANPGDRFFLLRQGRDPRGIMGSGVVTSEVFQAVHWDRDRAEDGKPANVVRIRFDALVDPELAPEMILTFDAIEQSGLTGVNLHPQSSGTAISESSAAKLNELWNVHLSLLRGVLQPWETPTPIKYFEGAVRSVFVNRYERDTLGRQACIDHWGTKCVVCGFDFQMIYGDRGRGFVEVHHLTPLAQIGERHEFDPIRDLRPVCCNCHAIIHRVEPMLTLEELQGMLKQ